MPLKHPGKKKLDKAGSRPLKKKESSSRRSDEDVDDRRPARKCPTHVLRFQVCLGAATAMVIFAVYRLWTGALAAETPRVPTFEIRSAPAAATPVQPSQPLPLSEATAGCTMERGYANKNIVGIEQFGVASPRECMNSCQRQRGVCNCWSWKDDGFCRTGSAIHCTYMASEDDDRWMYGTCPLRGGQVAEIAAAVQSEPQFQRAVDLRGVLSSSGIEEPVAKPTRPPALPELPKPALGSAAQVVAQNANAEPRAAVPLDAVAADRGAVAAVTGSSISEGASARSTEPPPPVVTAGVCPVLMITHKRANYLQRSLASLFRFRTDAASFPVIASQDGEDAEVYKALQAFLKTGQLFRHLQFQPKKFLPTGYERLAQHYGWALGQIFDGFGYEEVIVLEEDLEIAPDFFSFFEATRPLLKADPDLFCVSAWSDNGKADVAKNSTAVYRTDFFPGLGWMLLRSYWDEVKDRWPTKYWDDFLRRKDVRKERHCLRPEVSRTHTFGEKGVSYGQFYKEHLATNVLNEAPVDWKSLDLSHVATAAAFDEYLTQQVRNAKLIAFEDVSPSMAVAAQQALAILYDDRQWKRVAKRFGLMEDEKDGIRRGTYRGVLPFTWKGRSAFLIRDWPDMKSLTK